MMLLVSVTALTSCSDDRDSNPDIQKPTAFTLNTPAMSEQYIQLTAQNKVNLTWSQPNYGYNAFATYKIQVGVMDNGNAKWNTEDVVDENGKVTGNKPKYLETSFNVCNANISGEEIAMALCEIDGVTNEGNYVDKGYREVAMRVVSSVNTSVNEEVPNTNIVSNIITFKHMAAYCAVKSPAAIYIIGNCSGWKEPAEANADVLASWRIFETKIGSGVFQGIIDMPAGDLQFRFYNSLTGWDGGESIGSQTEDDPMASQFTNGVFEGTCVKPGKGAWLFKDFTAGKLKLTVDMNQKIVKFEKL